MEIPISELFSNSNPCFLAFNLCCVINLKSPYSLDFIGKKEHFIFPDCSLTSECFWGPEMRLQMTAEEISKRLIVCLHGAILHWIVPPISPASHCFYKWHLPVLAVSPRSANVSPRAFLPVPRPKPVNYWLDDKGNLNKPDIAVTSCPNLPTMMRKLCSTQATSQRKMEVAQGYSRGGFLPPCYHS